VNPRVVVVAVSPRGGVAVAVEVGPGDLAVGPGAVREAPVTRPALDPGAAVGGLTEASTGTARAEEGEAEDAQRHELMIAEVGPGTQASPKLRPLAERPASSAQE
jgi:hypothetical protein